jgi:hypothetical protein
MVNKSKELEDKEVNCKLCNDSSIVAVMNQFGEYELEQCLCIAEISFFQLHGIE